MVDWSVRIPTVDVLQRIVDVGVAKNCAARRHSLVVGFLVYDLFHCLLDLFFHALIVSQSGVLAEVVLVQLL